MIQFTGRVALVLALAISAAACGGSSFGVTRTLQDTRATEFRVRPARSVPIEHIVIIVQENRSTDNLFHGLAGADTANSGINSKGRVIPLRPVAMTAGFGVDHSHKAFVTQYDRGKMDRADLLNVRCVVRPCPRNPEFAYVNRSDVAPYFQMAQTYTFADHMFQTNQGPSFPAHQYIIAGTSRPSASSNLLASDNPENPDGTAGPAGCDAPTSTTVSLIDPGGNEAASVYPCFEHPTLMDLLDVANISWRYYAPDTSSIWTAPNSIRHMRFGTGWQKVIIPETKVLSDIANGSLASVSWVIPSGLASDHPIGTDGSGPSWVASIVNAVGNSHYWGKTAIFVVWDDWGGWYEHVPPPNIFNANELGFRVPLIVISPYARPAYVSHTNHEFGSILNFVETNFGLPSLGYSDSRSDNLSDCFNYSQTPLQFHTIKAPIRSDYFRRGLPQTPPDND